MTKKRSKKGKKKQASAFGLTDKPNLAKAVLCLNDLIKKQGTVRSLARLIEEPECYISMYRYGTRYVRVPAAVKIALCFDIDPSKLRSDIFPPNTRIVIQNEVEQDE